jgi:hypothetical protein
MPRVSLLFTVAVICAGVPALAQHPASSPLDVIYVTGDFNVLQAYDVDSKTGIPTAVGSPVFISENGSYVIPSPDDHFVYILAWDKANHEHLRVFATDENGALQQPPVQDLNIKNVEYFEIDPNGKFAYAVEETDNNQGETVATIWEASVDSETGLISDLSRAVGPSAPNGPCGTGWSVTGVLRFDGFNMDGSKFYYDWYCVTHDSISAGYFARDVDLETGMLGPKTAVHEWSENGNADAVWFTPRVLIDYDPNDYLGDSEVTVYPPSGGSKPLISCDGEMLKACASGWGAIADPAGVFMFLQTADADAVVAVIDLANSRLVSTGNHIPRMVEQISPDRTLLYTYAFEKRNPYYVTIYVFDSNTGAVQAGGTIKVPGQSYSLVSAVRK